MTAEAIFVSAVFVLLMVAASLLVARRLPEGPVPIHFNIRGKPDRFGSRWCWASCRRPIPSWESHWRSAPGFRDRKRGEKIDVGWLVREWGPFIRHVHIKDVIGVPGRDGDQFMFPLIGEGRVDWSEFFAALAAIQYRGYMSVEFESYKYYRTILKSDPAAASAISMAQLRALEDLVPAGLSK